MSVVFYVYSENKFWQSEIVVVDEGWGLINSVSRDHQLGPWAIRRKTVAYDRSLYNGVAILPAL